MRNFMLTCAVYMAAAGVFQWVDPNLSSAKRAAVAAAYIIATEVSSLGMKKL